MEVKLHITNSDNYILIFGPQVFNFELFSSDKEM